MQNNDLLQLMRNLDEKFDKFDEKLDTLGKRVSALEVWRAQLMASVAFITIALNAAWEYIKMQMSGKS